MARHAETFSLCFPRRMGTEGPGQEESHQEVQAPTQQGVLGVCALWGDKFHLKILWLRCPQVSLHYGSSSL